VRRAKHPIPINTDQGIGQKHANVHSAELSPSPANEDELETDLGPHLVTEDEQVIAPHGFMRDLGLRRQGEVAMGWEGVVRP
jgi:hypothetical protein